MEIKNTRRHRGNERERFPGGRGLYARELEKVRSFFLIIHGDDALHSARLEKKRREWFWRGQRAWPRSRTRYNNGHVNAMLESIQESVNPRARRPWRSGLPSSVYIWTSLLRAFFSHVAEEASGEFSIVSNDTHRFVSIFLKLFLLPCDIPTSTLLFERVFFEESFSAKLLPVCVYIVETRRTRIRVIYCAKKHISLLLSNSYKSRCELDIIKINPGYQFCRVYNIIRSFIRALQPQLVSCSVRVWLI